MQPHAVYLIRAAIPCYSRCYNFLAHSLLARYCLVLLKYCYFGCIVETYSAFGNYSLHRWATPEEVIATFFSIQHVL